MSGQGKDGKSVPGTSGGSPSLRPGAGGPPGRLPSFKAPRDLTLGSGSARPALPGLAGRNVRGVIGLSDPNKKKFVPNLNVQRRDKSQDDSSKSKTEIKQEPNTNHRGGRGGGGRGVGPAGRGGKNRPELIQTLGSVFSDGMGADGVIRRRFGGGGGGGDGREGSALERPKINLKSLDEKFDKAAEEERLKELLRDDFIDDLTTGNLVPVQLPMIDTGKVFKEVKKEEEDSDEDELRIMRGGKSKMKKRNVIVDSDDDENPKADVDIVNVENGQETKKEAKSVIKVPKKEKSSTDSKPELTFSDLVRGQNGDLLFIQLPDHLPVSVGDIKPQPGKPQDPSQKCTINTLPEGYLGKIQIRASGRTQLLIGEMALDIEFGTQVGFLQDLVSIHVPNQGGVGIGGGDAFQRGAMSVLGRVRHRLVVTPDWDKLFSIESSPDLESSDEEESQQPP